MDLVHVIMESTSGSEKVGRKFGNRLSKRTLDGKIDQQERILSGMSNTMPSSSVGDKKIGKMEFRSQPAVVETDNT